MAQGLAQKLTYDDLAHAALGVLHDWIVDPVAKSLECYRLESGVYRTVLTRKSPEPSAGSPRLLVRP
jgi:hypothetical protein